MKTKNPPITFQTAIINYFGGIKGLEKQTFPFTCTCGSKTYPADEGGEKPIMNVADCFTHVRRIHKEIIKKTLEKKPKNTQIFI